MCTGIITKQIIDSFRFQIQLHYIILALGKKMLCLVPFNE